MPEPGFLHLKDLLKHPQVIKVTDATSAEVAERRAYQPPLCEVFTHPLTCLHQTDVYRFRVHQEAKQQLPDIIDNQVQCVAAADESDKDQTRRFRRRRNIGIVFSGGPAPGGHNVVAGLYAAAKRANPDNKIFGFLVGPDGIIENETVLLDDDIIDAYRNLGGFTMIKTGRTKIDSAEKMDLSRKTCQDLELDALVIVGGDDSNTNAAFLAQEMFHDGIQVIGVPKTIDGDIQVRDDRGEVLCAMSFGFHTAARAFSNSISNLCTDCSSDVKYWHLCKVMGRVASHLALEVGLQTHANLVLVGEDLADYIDPGRIENAQHEGITDYHAYGMTLRHLSRVICNAIVRRAAVGKNYGVIIIPEGVLEFINEIQVFIIKLNTIIAAYNRTHDRGFHSSFPALEDKLEYLRRLAQRSRDDAAFTLWNSRDDDLFNDIPGFFQEGLLMERDSHGNFQFSQVETEKVLLGLVQDYLNILKEQGLYKIGIRSGYFSKMMNAAGLDPDTYGAAIFENYGTAEFLLTKKSIISTKTLRQALVDDGILGPDDVIPAVLEKIYAKSTPSFKTQLHFYGYDGRGNDPTRFDCVYTYNLGFTVF